MVILKKLLKYLREKGLAAAAKKAGRIAAEGLVYTYISEDMKVGSIVEVNCETDFVADNEEFVTLAEKCSNTSSKNYYQDS